MEDSKIFQYAKEEGKRQRETLSLIASENFIYPEALEIAKYPLSNKYSEGYPNKRFYCGCKWIDQIESAAIEYATKLFKCKYANVQCYSGSIANLSIYKALLKPGETILGMEMSSGGHLTHSSTFSFVTHYYHVETYTLNRETLRLDYENIRETALKCKPKLIIAGASSYPFSIDFKKFREIADEVGAYLLADICHYSGLVATGHHQHCFPYAHIAMCTTHKQLRGYRGALILWNDDDLTVKLNKSVFPGTQGGMNPAAVAINAYCLERNLGDHYKDYIGDVVRNAKIMVKYLQEKGVDVFGTETHLFLVNTKNSFELTGKAAADLLETAGIISNPNLLPFDTESPLIASGIRIGTLSLSTYKPTEEEVIWITSLLYKVLKNKDINTVEEVREELKKWLSKKQDE